MQREVATFCRICEAECGLVATVQDERLLDVRADELNPHSLGFMCTKPKAMIQILEDPDRVTRPLKRVGGPGEFAPVSWDEALGDIAERLKSIVDRDGGKAFATHAGNPTGFDVCGTTMLSGLRDAIGSPWCYGVAGEDSASFSASMALQLGSASLFLRPDVWRTDFLLMVGANPWISKGSIVSEPQLRKAMRDIVDRGGRVVIVDPRRTETARQFEHVSIRPGTDAWLFLGLLTVVYGEDLVDRQFCARHVNGAGTLESLVGRFTLEDCADRCGVPVETITDIARGFGSAAAAGAYGRVGLCTQRFGTLNNMLLNALNAVTGNVNRAGGAMFGAGAVDFQKLAKSTGANEFGTVRTRTLGLPGSLNYLPTQSLWRDITEPGDGRIRALCTFSANPVSSSGAGGARLEAALEDLELHFSLDLYVNETNKYADYILPGTTFYERPDVPLLAFEFGIRPTLYASERVVEPRGEARDEWRILNEIAQRMGLGGAYPVKPLRMLAKLGVNVHPLTLLDAAIRTGPYGDLFGLRRSGWSLKKLRERAPHGVKLADHIEPQPELARVLDTDDGRIRLVPAELEEEIERLAAHRDDDAFPMRMVGLRELKSHNSWMHNTPRLTSDDREPMVLVHPDDARAAGSDGVGRVEFEIESQNGRITMAARITDEVAAGVVAIPHGWGHQGGWKRANAAGGANANRLASAEPEDIERVAGMSILTGIPIRIRAVAPQPTGSVPAAKGSVRTEV